jgi:hypothetical protein
MGWMRQRLLNDLGVIAWLKGEGKYFNIPILTFCEPSTGFYFI